MGEAGVALSSGTEMCHLWSAPLLHLASFSHAGVQLSSYDSNVTTDGGPVWCLAFSTQRFPFWPQMQKLQEGNKMFQLRSDAHPQVTQLGWPVSGLCKTLFRLHRSHLWEARGQCLEVGAGPVDFLSGTWPSAYDISDGFEKQNWKD